MAKYKFWTVMGKGSNDIAYPRRLKAEAEAEKLALTHPGFDYLVMEAIIVYSTPASKRARAIELRHMPLQGDLTA